MDKLAGNNLSCCSCNAACCDPKEVRQPETSKIIIDFLYLDLNVCSRCQGTENTLDAAIAEVAQVLRATNRELEVNKIHVATEEMAIALRFVSSPTIRVNGKDIQLEVRENACESCGDLCDTEVDCRVWVYQGQEYTEPPKAMILEAILREVYGTADSNVVQTQEAFVLPDNLVNFYAALRKKHMNQ